ncbi:GntR family transcriptional regulator [Agaricicola taiwanensis]|uniref:GntR family transcriptional regulator n=1 Tax=Agaricicola taiwanensis TaxID=591372 RepID=A0A8J2YKG6_9RHOB|nr:GntR family transcriptional regulator [Agaricicola taiwanensis]GGE50499.1 GntR family transcriptional regulator [Agaricicola taiwanensis]
MNPLQRQLANRIVMHVRAMGLPVGHHLTESSLQDVLGTSRAPIRAALGHLAAEGLLQRIPNRGFFVNEAIFTVALDPRSTESSSDDQLYFAVAEDRLNGVFGPVTTEAELMRRYGVGRAPMQKVLARVVREGWIERREGRGYLFTPLVDSLEAYRENYELRAILEPAGILSPRYSPDREKLKLLQDQQEVVRDGGWQTLSQIELFETNARFHEVIASMSGNRFLAPIIARQNQLRRLVEYRQILNREQVRRQNEEHMEILAALGADERDRAASLMSDHLLNAKARKAKIAMFTNEGVLSYS